MFFWLSRPWLTPEILRNVCRKLWGKQSHLPCCGDINGPLKFNLAAIAAEQEPGKRRRASFMRRGFSPDGLTTSHSPSQEESPPLLLFSSQQPLSQSGNPIYEVFTMLGDRSGWKASALPRGCSMYLFLRWQWFVNLWLKPRWLYFATKAFNSISISLPQSKGRFGNPDFEH